MTYIFQPTDLVLAKVKGFSAWPAMIIPDELIPENILRDSHHHHTNNPVDQTQDDGNQKSSNNSNNIIIKNGQSFKKYDQLKSQYCIKFLADDSYSWIKSMDIKLLQDEEINSWLNNTKIRKNKKLIPAYKFALIKDININDFVEFGSNYIIENQVDNSIDDAKLQTKKGKGRPSRKSKKTTSIEETDDLSEKQNNHNSKRNPKTKDQSSIDDDEEEEEEEEDVDAEPIRQTRKRGRRSQLDKNETNDSNSLTDTETPRKLRTRRKVSYTYSVEDTNETFEEEQVTNNSNNTRSLRKRGKPSTRTPASEDDINDEQPRQTRTRSRRLSTKESSLTPEEPEIPKVTTRRSRQTRKRSSNSLSGSPNLSESEEPIQPKKHLSRKTRRKNTIKQQEEEDEEEYEEDEEEEVHKIDEYNYEDDEDWRLVGLGPQDLSIQKNSSSLVNKLSHAKNLKKHNETKLDLSDRISGINGLLIDLMISINTNKSYLNESKNDFELILDELEMTLNVKGASTEFFTIFISNNELVMNLRMLLNMSYTKLKTWRLYAKFSKFFKKIYGLEFEPDKEEWTPVENNADLKIETESQDQDMPPSNNEINQIANSEIQELDQ
ncbi:hypothetical protein TBLA_0B06870 [Henningerozyma blattae CBS 6284]|uniref:PWWP domain-containing protein n=1 Tax=Henningerozyma blattae (strain ATCC 34711 / CBS 6284 / DSM 70876 / NBRC 10599 / NRRL Y-10934 / UCD 77-7) TaxID=1071380 RepID=I2GZF6_HENB6|nr:hypothetical protein TBLA_0B06870 [Tetrapisispora blattae CBS 6284]CCH59508.1 hypothetical protein TBLA_0B06870 [Tetrapisispora blattae CBS 6284]